MSDKRVYQICEVIRKESDEGKADDEECVKGWNADLGHFKNQKLGLRKGN